jgi:diadenosine tetraphosphate (Ap4A) HIT family hydrolase
MPPLKKSDCKWCREAAGEVLVENDSFIAVFDGYPVNRGHTLIISKRHVADLFGLNQREFADLHAILGEVKQLLDGGFRPAGYNVGANCGEAAGQTIFHFHLHVIPRYPNDVPNPRGGVRNLKPPLVAY